jgi:hypothetical protein
VIRSSDRKMRSDLLRDWTLTDRRCMRNSAGKNSSYHRGMWPPKRGDMNFTIGDRSEYKVARFSNPVRMIWTRLEHHSAPHTRPPESEPCSGSNAKQLDRVEGQPGLCLLDCDVFCTQSTENASHSG